ncbi:MAG: tRNA (N6-threonylcarbamoyladenosine(37)-N6)-methyltransferase TrmO [Coriobacteriales bacterium]
MQTSTQLPGACPQNQAMRIEPIAHIRTPYGTKFGVPRQSGLVQSVEATIVFEPRYRNPDALRGIEGFSHLWLIWGFHQTQREGSDWSPLVRPPRLGGNEKIGVFACRSPFRPNNLGLSAVSFSGLSHEKDLGTVLKVRGADLVDGTPIFDIKPYIPFTDSIPTAQGGFASSGAPAKLRVECPEDLLGLLGTDAEALLETLACDPRPAFHNDPERLYGMTFAGHEVKFRVDATSVVHVHTIE